MGGLQPRMRAGDRDRHRVVELLGKHFAEGRLSVDEFDERVGRAHAAVHLDELPALTADLPGDPPPQQSRPRRPRLRTPSHVLVLVLAVLLVWSVVAAVVHAGPPLVLLLLLFLLFRHRGWCRRC